MSFSEIYSDCERERQIDEDFERYKEISELKARIAFLEGCLIGVAAQVNPALRKIIEDVLAEGGIKPAQ